MSRQASQVSSGTIPTRISNRNSQHPRQNPTNASNDAATRIAPTRAVTNAPAPKTTATSAPTESVAPMPWAKRFGGPGVSRTVHARRGRTTRVTSVPSGLSVGPVATRATNPQARMTTRTVQPVIRTATH